MLKIMPFPCAVAASACSSSRWTEESRPSMRPTTRKTMSLSRSVFSSRLRYSFRSAMSVATSRCGSFQFSVENAKSVRAVSSRRAAVSTVARTESIPARWPSTRGRRRCRAQRPLPSMMTATCRGRRPRSRASRSARSGVPGAAMESLSIIGIGGETCPRAWILSRRNGRDGGGREVPGKRLRGIQNPREREAARFRGWPGLREGVLGTNAAPARVPERPHEPAHHAAKEAVPSRRDEEKRTFLRNVQPRERAHGRSRVGARERERSEVAPPDEGRRGGAHRRHVERLGGEGLYEAAMGVEELAAPQAVDVDLADRRVAGVEVGGGFGGAQDPHVLR